MARIPGATGWAHIILRGINRENLFYDEADYERMASTLNRFQKELGFKTAAFCLMSNHAHLLIYSDDGAYAQIMKKITVSYAVYYNRKYDRVGHVFQDRFRSEPVNDEAYLMAVVRYIYQNPQKAGICSADEYPHTYISGEGIFSGYFDTEEEMMEYLNAGNDDRCMEFDTCRRIGDEEALRMICEALGTENPQLLQELDPEKRNEMLRSLKQKSLTVRQISRLTGINRNIIQRA